ncbi:MAG TPA: hypothetical protein VHL58_02485 [Thermoanaerobaculia bacterium]|nr:hypothetical protein [Thermoanaerobaculia bacterium]
MNLVPESFWRARLGAMKDGGSNALWAFSDLLNVPINIWMFVLGVTIMALRPDAADARLSSLTLTSWASGNFLAAASGVGAMLRPFPPAFRGTPGHEDRQLLRNEPLSS